MEFMSLPVVMIENIFSYLTYDEIAKNRILSKLLDDICKRMLNRGFLMIERRHAMALKSVKTQLPRRESERRYHPLSRHCDILTSIETRISMLNMTYSKFIDNGLCCFIPGRVIDEIRRVLSIVETSKTPPRAHEVLQELRDISSMAIEHFDDKVSPEFRRRLQEGACAQPQRQAAAILAPVQLRSEMNQLQRRSLVNAKLSLFLASQYKKVFKRMVEYRRTAWKQRKTILNMSRKQKEHGNAIADLRRRIEECDVKYSELTHTNQAGGVKAIAATAGDSSAPAQPLRHFGSQIKLDLSVLPIGTSKRNPNKSLPNMKPRKPLIKLPSLSEDAEPLEKVPNTVDNPSPSTSIEKPTTRTKAESDIAKIRGVTNQLRHMSKNFDGDLKGFDGKSKNFDGKSKADGKLKRPSSLNQDAGNVKKHKLD